MSSETALTGRLGRFTVDGALVARTTTWEVSPALANTSEWGDSDSGGYTNRAAGRRDSKFTAEGKFDTDTEVYDTFQPEDIANSVLWMNTVLYWAFPRALCMDFKLSVNIDTEEVIGWTSSWGADGIFYRPGQADAPVETLP
ncbi:MAG: hypothetical protein WCX48_11330 [Bacteroidales bacterium]